MGISTKAVGAVALAPVVMIALAGCMQQPIRQSEPLPSETSAFKAVLSEQEALDAAKQAYAEYLAMSDLIAQEGGANPERLAPYVSKGLLKDEISGFKEIEKNGWHAEGNSSFDNFVIQASWGQELTSYLCIDHSLIRLFDSNSLDVTSSSRIDRYPLQVSFSFKEGLVPKIESSETWVGENFC